MVSWISGFIGRLARLALALTLLGVIVSCSGAVGPAPGPSTAITITPAAATLFSDLPTTFVIAGGNGSYVVTSDNQSVIPFISSFSGNVLTIVPGSVAADTIVAMTVRDTAGSTPATATLTVKPRTLSNTVTVTPSASQSAACGTSVCSGGDAEVKVTLSQAGLPLVNREVRFDVVSGDFRIITSPAGVSETLALSATTFTDATGTARIRIRVLADATSQTALLQITDVASGSTLRTSFAIAPSSNAPLNAQPSQLQFTGPDGATCANGISADVIVFGGHPPYSISNPGTFTVSPIVLARSGDRFTVTANGQCTAGSAIAIVDANGATVNVTATNALGAVRAGSPFVVSPIDVTLDTCNGVATVAIAGGLGPSSYFAASGSSTVFASTSGNYGFVRRQSGDPSLTGLTTVNVSFSDGRSAQPVTVHLRGTLAGQGGGQC